MNRSILVADGDGESRSLLCRLLKIFGYEEIWEAKDGLEALDVVVQKSPEFVVLDTQLPKLDGFLLSEILSKVSRFQHISVALMGVSLDSQIVDKGMQAGAYAFLEKPLTPEGVKRVLAGIRKSDIQGKKMSQQAEVIVSEFAGAAKGMLTLIFGQQGRVLKVEELSLDMRKKAWDVSGILRAKGTATVEIALGVSMEMAKSLAGWLGKKDLSPASLGQAEGELLTSIYKRSQKRLQEIYVVKPEPVQVSFNAPLAVSPKAVESYGIHLCVGMQRAILQKELTLFLAVTLIH